MASNNHGELFAGSCNVVYVSCDRDLNHVLVESQTHVIQAGSDGPHDY